MMAALKQPINPSSVHQFGRLPAPRWKPLEKKIAEAVQVQPSALTFTSGGTESNNMILMGFRTVFASSVEHEAVLAACPGAYIIDVDQNGVICLDHLEALLSALADEEKDNALVSVMAANNETGVIQPLRRYWHFVPAASGGFSFGHGAGIWKIDNIA